MLGTVAAGLIGGKGAQLTADWVAGPGMLGIFPAHGGGAVKEVIPDNNPPKAGVTPDNIPPKRRNCAWRISRIKGRTCFA